MTTEERVKQLEDVMVEMLRKQGRTVEELAGLREGQSELNTKVVRLENQANRTNTRLDGLTRIVEQFQQETTAGLAQIVDLIRGLK